MRYINRLPEPKELATQYPISDELQQKRIKRLQEIEDVIVGVDSRKLLIIGPCSADCEGAVLDYMSRLAELQNRICDKFIMIPRVYTGKPRTNGMGYKGMVHRPSSNSEDDDLTAGIVAMRKLHKNVIEQTGMFAADELLYPETYRYVSDLLVYSVVGARSVENQQHRLFASGIDIPVGMKNPTSGNISVMLNAIVAAQNAQRLIVDQWEVESSGNCFAHAILRGYVDGEGRNKPNYHYEDLCNVYDCCYKANIKNAAVIIDCNHSNSNKHFEEQPRIAEEVLASCRQNTTINSFVKGLMIESYLVDGAQMIGGGEYGKSITDPCLGFEKTEKLIDMIMGE